MKNEKWIIIFLPFLLFASVKQKIISFYKKIYPEIIIKKIQITPPPPKKYKNFKILFSPKTTSGNIKIDNQYYYVRIKAKIPVFVANSVIKTNQPIYNNVIKKIIPFKYFYSKPLFKITKNLVASNIISKNSVITKSNTKIAPDVFRDETITVLIISKDITIYAKAKALQDGYIGDIINIKFRKKIQKAKIIKKGTVILKVNE